MAARSFFVLAAALLGGGCGSSSEDGLELRLGLRPPSLDFGMAIVEATDSRTVEVSNPSSESVLVRVISDDGAFAAHPESFEIAPTEAALLSVDFTPKEVGSEMSSLALAVEQGPLRGAVLSLQGQGVQLRVTPLELDFGRVAAGRTRSLSLSIDGGESGTSLTVQGGANVRWCADSDPGAFCFTVPQAELQAPARLQVPAGETRDIEVRFRAEAPIDPTPQSEGALILRRCEQPSCEVRVPLSAVSVASSIECGPAEVAFGEVIPEFRATQTLRCRSISSEPVEIRGWALTSETQAAFGVELSEETILEPGEIHAIELEYAPQAPGAHGGELEIRLQDEVPVRVHLTGTGGDSRLGASPETVDFGWVPLLASVSKDVLLTNTGFTPLTIAELQLIGPDAGSFSIADGASARVLQPAETAKVGIEFGPLNDGLLEAALRVLAHDGSQSRVAVQLRGQGVDLPPCDYEVASPELSFEAVTRTRTLRQAVEVRNLGTSQCLIYALRLVPETDPEYVLSQPDQVPIEVAPGTTTLIEVDFSPMQARASSGELELRLSHPNRGLVRIPLSGRGIDEGLDIYPRSLDFGTLDLACGGRSREVLLENNGSRPLELTDLLIRPGASTSFTFEGPASLPHTLGPGESLGIRVDFQPQSGLERAATLVVRTREAGTPAEYVVPLRGAAEMEGRQVEELRQLPRAKVDLLFLIDKSGSMGVEQAFLGQNIHRLLARAAQEGIDYQIGVTSNDQFDEAGRLTSADAGTTRQSAVFGPMRNRIVTPRTQDPAAVLAANFSYRLRGGVHSDIAAFATALLATSPPLAVGHNAGFLRSDALLSVVLMSDEHEGSNGTVEAYLRRLRAIKGPYRPNDFMFSAVAAPPPAGLQCTGPAGGAASRGRFLAMVESTGGGFESICSSDWAELMDGLSPRILGLRTTFFLRHPAAPGTAQLSVEGLHLPPRDGRPEPVWSIGGHTLKFRTDAAPERGATIRVSYAIPCP